jgi:hypothetical protein
MSSELEPVIKPTRLSDDSDSGCILCEARGEEIKAAYPYSVEGFDGYVEACGPAHAAEQIRDDLMFRKGFRRGLS